MMINIVDDDEAVRDSLHMLLEELGHTVKTYASAEPLLRGDWDCDCLLVDQHMPGITGIDLLEYLRAKGDATPAVLVSGGANGEIIRRARHLAVPVLQKPVAENTLMDQIENACRISG